MKRAAVIGPLVAVAVVMGVVFLVRKSPEPAPPAETRAGAPPPAPVVRKAEPPPTDAPGAAPAGSRHSSFAGCSARRTVDKI